VLCRKNVSIETNMSSDILRQEAICREKSNHSQPPAVFYLVEAA
jgi:hypothetical protein